MMKIYIQRFLGDAMPLIPLLSPKQEDPKKTPDPVYSHAGQPFVVLHKV